MKMSVNTGASSLAQCLRVAGDTRSGPHAFLVFWPLKSLRTLCSVMTSGAGEEVAGGKEAGVVEGGGPLGASNLVQNTLNWYGRFGSLEVGGGLLLVARGRL